MRRTWTFLREHYKNVSGKRGLLRCFVKLTFCFHIRSLSVHLLGKSCFGWEIRKIKKKGEISVFHTISLEFVLPLVEFLQVK